MASSSSANYSYDVFLSFRGTDTRNNFTSHLHKALCDNNVKAFIDTRIDRGEEITPFLEKIIEGVKLSIIVFSQDYASPTFCLDEMAKIMECKDTKSQIVLPISYKIYPDEEMYNEAFARHEQTSKHETTVERLKSFLWRALHWIAIYLTYTRYEVIIRQEMKVDRWKSSFQKALELAGWHVDDNRNEAQVIEEITRDVLERLNSQFEGEMKSTQIVGQTSKNYLGKIMQCLMNDENPKVGVWGMGGVGKKTIVTHVNNKLLKDATFSRHIYWVTVSKDSRVSKLQGDIAKAVNLDLSREENESKRATKLFNELMRINKFVLILNDVWEAELDKGNAILDELIQSSLLKNNVKTYKPIKMHDVVRDMARIIVKDELQFQDPFESVQALTLDWSNVFSILTPHCSKLRTLVFTYNERRDLPGGFFANMQSLNVLHMEGVDSIPYSITNLGNLKVLIISKGTLSVPSLVGLKKLQYLNVSFTEIPVGIEIEMLVNLRVLDLSNTKYLGGSFPNGVIEQLSHLQTLDLHGSSVEVEPEALISLQKLEILRIAFHDIHKLDYYLKSRHS